MRASARPALTFWFKVREQCAAKATSIGALMDTMHESVLDELNGAEIRMKKL